jgi:hypothetical protein
MANPTKSLAKAFDTVSTNNNSEDTTVEIEGQRAAPTTLEPGNATSTTEFERRDATEEEIQTLRHVVDTIPRVAWVALMIGAAERFTYYGITAPWRMCSLSILPYQLQMEMRLRC